MMAGRDPKTSQQRRAAEAAQRVEELTDKPKKLCERYNSLIGSLPVLLRKNGILQTVAYLMAKAAREKEEGEKAEALLLEHLTGQIRTAGLLSHEQSLQQKLVRAGFSEYLRIQEEAIACAAWRIIAP